MLKLAVCTLFIVVGLVAVFSQVFRMDPNAGVFLGGVVLAIFGGIGFADRGVKA